MNRDRIKKLFGNRTVKIIVVALVALLLLFAVWKVFFKKSEKSDPYVATEREERLSRLLEQIEGIDGASVLISEQDGVAVGVVVVFKGDDGVLTRLRITEVAATALGLQPSSVLVYPAA